MPFANLAKIAARLPVPKDYFNGLSAPGVVRADNILMFFREGFADLQQRSLEHHSHHRFVLLAPLEGSAGVNLDGAEHPLEPGMALLVYPFQFHFFLRPVGARLAWLILTFDSEAPDALARLRDTPVRLRPEAMTRLEALLRAYAAKRPGGAGEVRLAAETLLQHLASSADSALAGPVAGATKGPVRGAGDWLTRINRRLHEGGAGEQKIATLAAEFGVSERLLRLRFQESYGVSLGAYIHNFRLNLAAGLLTRSDIPLGEVANRCGYASQAAFSRAFRDRTGFAPRDYRAARRA